MHRLFELPRHLRDAERRAQGVKVLAVVTHDVHRIGALEEIPQRMCHDPRFHPSVLLHRRGLAAKELRLPIHQDDGLIAAAAER